MPKRSATGPARWRAEGGERGLGRRRERARLANFQRSTAFAAVRARQRRLRQRQLGQWREPTSGESRVTARQLRERPFPFFWLLSPLPRAPAGLHFRVHPILELNGKSRFSELRFKVVRKPIGPLRLSRGFLNVESPGLEKCDCAAFFGGPHCKSQSGHVSRASKCC